jgi:hypothetical protein
MEGVGTSLSSFGLTAVAAAIELLPMAAQAEEADTALADPNVRL